MEFKEESTKESFTEDSDEQIHSGKSSTKSNYFLLKSIDVVIRN